MKPAEPDTSTRSPLPSFPVVLLISAFLVSVVLARDLGSGLPDLLHRELRTEGEAVPGQIVGDAALEVEVRRSQCPVEPNGRDLGDRAPKATRLGRELQADLETLAAVDADLA